MTTFDFKIARSTQVEYTCPSHGTEACNCQMVIILVYNDNRAPVSLIIHGNDEHTWFYLDDSPSQRRDRELEMSIRRILDRNNIESENLINLPQNIDDLESNSEVKIGLSSPEIPGKESRTVVWARRHKFSFVLILITIVAFTAGSLGGYQFGIHRSTTGIQADSSTGDVQKPKSMAEQVNPPEGFKIPVRFGSIGPKLHAAGAIDYHEFDQALKRVNKPLTDDQINILNSNNDEEIVISGQNAYFLLNFFWALGLTNLNPILTKGPMMDGGREQAGNFASISNWTIGSKPSIELFASQTLVSLNSRQQTLLEKVASNIYRPCCDSPINFPDCNHGMALLGLLELMASQNANEDQMYLAAKSVNAFWYPQQSLEIALYFLAVQNVNFQNTKPSDFVSVRYASGTGFKTVHDYLLSNNLLLGPNLRNFCGIQ